MKAYLACHWLGPWKLQDSTTQRLSVTPRLLMPRSSANLAQPESSSISRSQERVTTI
jgi:hypothetical protein